MTFGSYDMYLTKTWWRFGVLIGWLVRRSVSAADSGGYAEGELWSVGVNGVCELGLTGGVLRRYITGNGG